MQTKVTLLSYPQNVRETLYSIWKVAHSGEEILLPEEIARRCKTDAVLDREVDETFKKIITAGIPVMENAFFVFLLENIPVELRDQLVRHKIGVRCGDTYILETAPDQTGSTFWAQTLRINDMGKFAEEGRFRMPEDVVAKGQEKTYLKALEAAQTAYRTMIEVGIPVEEARGVLPLTTLTRMTWGCSLSALQHICGKRTCWIAQATLWTPVIVGIARELEKVHPLLGQIADPPCYGHGGEWVGCKYHLQNAERIQGKDPLVPCSLYLGKHARESREASGENALWKHSYLTGRFECADPVKKKTFLEMSEKFSNIWGRDPQTGEKLEDNVDENHGSVPETI